MTTVLFVALAVAAGVLCISIAVAMSWRRAAQRWQEAADNWREVAEIRGDRLRDRGKRP